MCGCGKKNCGCIPVGPMGPQGPAGQPGQRGDQGLGIRQSYVSDGVTPIGNIIYPANTLVFQMTDLTYQSAGIVYSAIAPALTWIDLVMQNGTTAGTGVNKPQYAISNGFLHLRGTIDASTVVVSTAYFAFANIPAGTFSATVTTSISRKDSPSSVCEFDVLTAGDLKIRQGGSDIWLLDSIVPISIR